MTEWLPIHGFEDLYWVSSSGEIQNSKGHIMKPTLNKRGYLDVRLYRRGKATNMRIHRAVATAFIREPLPGEEVNHKDFNKTNNLVENLEWCTGEENRRHAKMHGRIAARMEGGYIQSRRKLTESIAREIADRYRAGEKQTHLAAEFGVTRWTIQMLFRGLTYQGVGRVDRGSVKTPVTLTAEIVAEIHRLRLSEGLTFRQIGSRLGVAKSAAHRAFAGRSQHV